MEQASPQEEKKIQLDREGKTKIDSVLDGYSLELVGAWECNARVLEWEETDGRRRGIYHELDRVLEVFVILC